MSYHRVVRGFVTCALLVVALYSHSFSATAADVILAWDPSPDPRVTGYRIHYGGVSGQYTNSIAVGTVTTATLPGLVVGTRYYFAATAFDGSGDESDFSNEVSYTPTGTTNQPPTLNALGNLTISESAGPQVVNLSGISSGGETQTLSVTAGSSHPGLIPSPTVNYTSPNATGTLSFTPVAFAFGSATITVQVNDGGAVNNVATRTFTVTVNPVNQAPTLNPLANIMINEGAGQQTVNLAGISTGASNEVQTLSITATSSNPGLIPNPIVSYTSPNATGTIAFTPVAGAGGSATITVTVNDGGASNSTVSRTFVATVNRLPTISAISNQVMTVGAAISPIPFTIGDAETAATSLTVSASSTNQNLIANPNIVIGGSGANRTLNLAPVGGQAGVSEIRVTVSDGFASASRSFLLTVSQPPAPPTDLRVVELDF